jgi:hypothetical protein
MTFWTAREAAQESGVACSDVIRVKWIASETTCLISVSVFPDARRVSDAVRDAFRDEYGTDSCVSGGASMRVPLQ